ncbi:hypothetical protein O3M35_000880 [Rhynocoris fuscipes]|uniref:Uncharacterized protein n=1 Tax=Rhynocoris fuscipes TaxID=488301 RepID=A0AAW1DN98_9HEMI
MHSILLIVAVVATCTMAARLDTSYLPPRGTAGSGAGFIPAPFGGAGGGAGFGAGAGAGFGAGAGAGFGAGGGAYAGYRPSGPVIPIISYVNNPNQGDGSYSYSYETGNGIKAQESGHQSAVAGPEGPGTAAQGGFSYTGPDGVQYSITYTADENGFRPQGAHLPTPPPIPPEILKSLQQQGVGGFGGSSNTYIAPAPGTGFGGSYNPSTGYHYKK